MTDSNNKLNIEIEITYDPEADFKYFTTESAIHDGTLIFEMECAGKCCMKIMQLETYDKTVVVPENKINYKFKYTVGNIVIVNEYGDQFAPTEKPWLRQKTTALLPIIFRCEVNG